MKKKRTYWYMTEITECVLCGRQTKYRYRVYDRPKPKDPSDRIKWNQDACATHFI